MSSRRFVCLCRLRTGGRFYSPGDEVELTEAYALSLPPGTVEPLEEVKKTAKEVEPATVFPVVKPLTRRTRKRKTEEE